MENDEMERCRAHKLAALGRLASGMAHDLNNILGVIEGYAAFVLKAMPADDPVRADVEEMLKAEQRAAALTKELMLFSGKSGSHKTEINMSEFTAELVKKASGLIVGDVAVEIRVAPDLMPVPVDAAQLERALLALLVNARDAMPGGGEVKVDIGNAEPAGGARKCPRPAEAGDRFVKIRVSDTGAGMSADTLDHMFEPFFTTKPKGKGKGLGLAIVHGIVSRHNGWVEVGSEEGKGSVFTIYLPAASGGLKTGGGPDLAAGKP